MGLLREAQGRGLMEREKEGELTADAWRTQRERKGGREGGGTNEREKGGRKKRSERRRRRRRRRRVIERGREERCWQSWRNREEMGRDGVWRGVAKLMVLPGEIVVNQSCLNKSIRPRRIFKKCLFN